MKSISPAGLLAILFWSTSATAFKLALQEMGFFQLLLQATLFSALFFWIILTVKKRIFNPLTLKWRTAMLSGALNPTVYYLILFYAYQISPAQFVIALNYTWPLMLTLLLVLIFKERLGLHAILCLLFSFSGVVIIFLTTPFYFERVNYFGFFLALLSSFFWALYWLLNLRFKQPVLEKLAASFFYALFYLIMLFPFFMKGFKFSWRGLLLSVYIALFEMGVTFLLWLSALQKTQRRALLANLVFLAPFLSLLWVNLIIREKILTTTFWGLLLIVGGIIAQRIFSTEQNQGG